MSSRPYIELPRASVRPASNFRSGSSHSRAGNYEAGLSSGTTPDAAAGGTRQAARPSGSPLPLVPELEGHLIRTVAAMFLAGLATVALLTLVAI